MEVVQVLPWWHCTGKSTGTQFRWKPHPFQQAALVTKDEVRGFQRPATEVRTSLATTMWLRAALNELPNSDPNYPFVMALLEEELRTLSTISSATPRRSNQASSTKVRNGSNHLPVILSVMKRWRNPYHKPNHMVRRLNRWAWLMHVQQIQFEDLPPEVRSLIFTYASEDCEPISPIFEHFSAAFVATAPYVKTGLPALQQVFPELCELDAMLSKYYSPQVFQFDLRDEHGLADLWQWIDQRAEEASGARTISLYHYTWYYSSSDYCWSYVPDATVFTLTSSGHIRLKKASQQLDPDSCLCAIADLVAAQFPEWKEKEQWSLLEFIAALRQERDPLIDAVVKFVDVLQEHEEHFRKLEAGRKPCTGCGKQMVFLRTSSELN